MSRCKACNEQAFGNDELCSKCLLIIKLAEEDIDIDYMTYENWAEELYIETGIWVDKDERN